MTTNTIIKTLGVTDLPVDLQLTHDLLDISKYVNGLVEFISKCSTPMTISLQGDWGSGKTSFMNVILDQLEKNTQLLKGTAQNEDQYTWLEKNHITEKVSILKFNTWTYSQFNQQDQLHISFITYLLTKLLNKSLEEILQDLHQEENLNQADRNLYKSIADVVSVITMATKLTLDSSPSDYVQTFLGVFKRKNSDFKIEANDIAAIEALRMEDSAKMMEKLRTVFQEVVNRRLKQDGTDRIVIFIDDLDRLNPLIAVNLLEIIKLFVDVNNCVFVLAIDFSVVSEGLHTKFSNTNITQEKAQSFFDKIIQVPYSIPVEFYSFNKLLQQHLNAYIKNDHYFDKLNQLLSVGIGHNPRGIKRLLNSFYLITSIMRNGDVNMNQFNESDYAILLSTLTLQLTHKELYTLFLKSDAESILAIVEEDTLKEEYQKFNVAYTEKQLSKQLEFLEHLCEFLNIKPEEENHSPIIKQFERLFQYSKVTGIESNEKQKNVKRLTISLNDYKDYKVKKAYKIIANLPGLTLTEKTPYSDITEKLLRHAIDLDPNQIDFLNTPQKLLEAGISSRFIIAQIEKELENGNVSLSTYLLEQNIKFKYPKKRSRQVHGTSFQFNTNTTNEQYALSIFTLLKAMHYPYLDQLYIDIDIDVQ